MLRDIKEEAVDGRRDAESQILPTSVVRTLAIARTTTGTQLLRMGSFLVHLYTASGGGSGFFDLVAAITWQPSQARWLG